MTMYRDNKFGHMHLVSNTSTQESIVSRWIPPALEKFVSTRPSDAQKKSLNEISVDLAILSHRTKKILEMLNQTGSLKEQVLFQLTEHLDSELTQLLAIAQSLNTTS